VSVQNCSQGYGRASTWAMKCLFRTKILPASLRGKSANRLASAIGRSEVRMGGRHAPLKAHPTLGVLSRETVDRGEGDFISLNLGSPLDHF
jgi:hypothetical protein